MHVFRIVGCACFCLCLTVSASAQITFEGCRDVRGLAVASVPIRGLGDVAKAGEDPLGRPIIAYDPVVLSQVIHPQTRRFFYAHECGHHALGHPLQGLILGQEQAADCWGIVTLYKTHAISDDDLAVIEGDMARIGPGDWTHLPGPVRAINLESCLEAAGLKPHTPSAHDDSMPPKADKCQEEYQDCMDEVQSQDDCMSEHIQSCMNDCLGNFHYPYQACQMRFCNLDMGSNVAWADRCERKIARSKHKCSGDRRDCRQEAAGKSSE